MFRSRLAKLSNLSEEVLFPVVTQSFRIQLGWQRGRRQKDSAVFQQHSGLFWRSVELFEVNLSRFVFGKPEMTVLFYVRQFDEIVIQK